MFFHFIPFWLLWMNSQVVVVVTFSVTQYDLYTNKYFENWCASHIAISVWFSHNLFIFLSWTFLLFFICLHWIAIRGMIAKVIIHLSELVKDSSWHCVSSFMYRMAGGVWVGVTTYINRCEMYYARIQRNKFTFFFLGKLNELYRFSCQLIEYPHIRVQEPKFCRWFRTI